MKVFAIFDDKGFPKGFYTPVIHSAIPKEAVCITVAQWHHMIRNSGASRWDGEKVVECFPGEHSAHVARETRGRAWNPFRIIMNIFR